MKVVKVDEIADIAKGGVINCSSCVYYAANADQCRRRSPAMTNGPTPRWRNVAPTDWCGEYVDLEGQSFKSMVKSGELVKVRPKRDAYDV